MSILLNSEDPMVLPGQTFTGTSASVLHALQTQGQVPFVLGVNEGNDGALGGFAQLGAAMQQQAGANNGVPAMIGSFMADFGVARHYYRGALKRVGTGDEPFSVLMNGERVTVPAVHVRGDMSFTDKTLTPEIWWLDDPGNPITLKWQIQNVFETITRIDWPPPAEGGTGRGDGGGGAFGCGGGASTGLASKDCRAELTGVYFTTGSAEVLDASMPALKRFAALMAAHPAWVVTVEGHTDNIGSADYNMDLSARRASAVRDVLVNKLKVPAAQLQSKGYDLTRPVESNATVEGRAHNRRVEVSRKCP